MTDNQVRERIIQATVALLQEGQDLSALTVRHIANRAQVAVGSINYNFGSKDDLINEAIWHIVGDVAAAWYKPDAHTEVDPETRLRQLLKQGARVMFQYKAYMDVGIKHVLENGDMQVKVLILPLLRQIFGTRKTELEIRMVAFQLIASLQVAFLNIRQIGDYLGVNVSDMVTVDSIIDIAVTNLIGTEQEEKTK